MRIQLPSNPAHQAAAHKGLNELGRLAVGEKRISQKDKEYPASVDYFVCRGDEVDLFHKLYGEKPRELAIKFFSSNSDHCCDERLELRNEAGKLVAYGDGETFWFFSDKAGRYIQITTQVKPNFMDDSLAFVQESLPPHKAKNVKWRQVLRVRFLLADFPKLGYFQFSTSATKTSIPAIRNVFDECLKAFGTVQYIPFTLKVKQAKSNTPGKADQYPIVSLIPQISLEEGFALQSKVLLKLESEQPFLAALPTQPATETGQLAGQETDPINEESQEVDVVVMA